MITRTTRIAAAVLCSALGTLATVNSGMALLHLSESGSLELKYLSTGTIVRLSDGLTRDACFSPDGRKVAFFVRGYNGQNLYSVNIDGTDLTRLNDITTNLGAGTPTWCTNGYIYWKHGSCFLSRVIETGGVVERTYEGVDTTKGADGSQLDCVMNDLQMSRDGTRGTVTVARFQPGLPMSQATKLGYAQKAIRFDTHQEWGFTEPCQGAISPSGNTMSVSMEGHRTYRFYGWDLPFMQYGTAEDPDRYGNTYIGCYGGPYQTSLICPGYDTVVQFGRDLGVMFGIGTGLSTYPTVGWPHWSHSEENVFIFSTDNPRNENSGGGWLYEFSTHQYTKVAPLGNTCMDYFGQEINLAAPFTLTPSTLGFMVDSDGMPGPKTVSLTSAQDMTGAPAITGAAMWLSVSAAPISARKYSITNTLVRGRLPAPHALTVHACTVAVTPFGSSTAIEYVVHLMVVDAVPEPVVIHNPLAGQIYTVGDTLKVRYSADSTLMTGTKIQLSVDAGESWVLMTSSDSYLSGSNREFPYVIPAQLPGGTAPVSTECLVMVGAYPDGYEATSGVFTIAAPTSVWPNRRSANAGGAAVTVGGPSHSNVLAVRETYAGTGAVGMPFSVTVYGIDGRIVHHGAAAAGGRYQTSCSGWARGTYLVRAQSASWTVEQQVLAP